MGIGHDEDDGGISRRFFESFKKGLLGFLS